jgi:hypothetical protein
MNTFIQTHFNTQMGEMEAKKLSRRFRCRGANDLGVSFETSFRRHYFAPWTPRIWTDGQMNRRFQPEPFLLP